ncbi:unnamed protein product, partial [Ectocarpus sp. 8 AP-2014]
QIIDAGSSGSRMHVYQWEPRMVAAQSPFTRFSATMTFSSPCSVLDPPSPPCGLPQMKKDIAEALSPLVDFAKDILKDYEEDWERFPIYLKATAGVRQLPYGDREALLSAVRDFLGNPETCPFYFQFDHARVISGEE